MNLENQSKEVMTYVETFLQNETIALIYDNDQLDQWNQKILELGLEGQKDIQSTDKSPCAFMHMKQTLVNVFKELCPVTVSIEKYNKTAIPIEILDLVSLSKQEKYFDKIEIWYDDKSPDPICVGLRFQDEEDRLKGYTWRMDKYIIGKWGDVKRSFQELTDLAKDRWLKRKKIEYTQAIKDAQRKLDDIETECYNDFGDNKTSDLDLPF